MKKCRIAPPSCTQRGAPCCAGCGNRACEARCLNSPKLCGCWEESPPPGARRGPPPKADPLKVAYLYSLGMTQTEIARWLGVCRNTVAKALREGMVAEHGDS